MKNKVLLSIVALLIMLAIVRPALAAAAAELAAQRAAELAAEEATARQQAAPEGSAAVSDRAAGTSKDSPQPAVEVQMQDISKPRIREELARRQKKGELPKREPGMLYSPTEYGRPGESSSEYTQRERVALYNPQQEPAEDQLERLANNAKDIHKYFRNAGFSSQQGEGDVHIPSHSCTLYSSVSLSLMSLSLCLSARSHAFVQLYMIS